jgi:lipopolysaccharide O-acetyltransferase
MTHSSSGFKASWRWYGLFGSVRLFLDLAYTRLFYPRARLVRLPCRVRSAAPVHFNTGFTSGIDLRLDVFSGGVFDLGERIQINDHVHIGVACHVSIGDDTLIASRVFITDHDHGEYASLTDQHSTPATPPSQRPLVVAPVKVGKRVWLGEGVSVLKGVTIGDGAIIGAGAVVNKDIPADCIAVGVPARVIKRYMAETGRWEST